MLTVGLGSCWKFLFAPVFPALVSLFSLKEGSAGLRTADIDALRGTVSCERLTVFLFFSN